MTGDDILSIEDRKTDSVIVPQWNGAEIFVRTMGALERAKYEVKLLDLPQEPLEDRIWQIRVSLVVLCACDKDMNRLFKDSDFDRVAQKNGDAINLIFDLINRINLITPDVIEDAAGN